jgi:regulator of CtrA degradation
MAVPADINPRIVDSLYCDALVLADELRARFALRGGGGEQALSHFSCEGLRATTRTMHCLAWLLNTRAYFAGEISEFQLRRHGRLPAALPASDPATLPPEAARLVVESERLYARIARLEHAWRRRDAAVSGPSAIERLRERLASAG